MTGLVFMVAHYLTTLLMVFVLALVVDALAPLFGGTKNPVQALKLVAYGSTASFVGGIFGAIQSLSFLGLLASLYSIWLIYTGVAPLMRSPVGKSVAYTVVIVIAAIVARVLIGALTGLLSWFPGFGSQSAADAAAAWARVVGA